MKVLSTRPLPVFFPHVFGTFDAIHLADHMIGQLYEGLTDRGRLTRTVSGDAERVLLLGTNLHRANAEMAYRGTCDTLLKTRNTAQEIARRSDIELQVDFSMPDLSDLPRDPLPAILGVGEPASEHDPINRVRNQLDGLYDDARTATRDDRVEIALLWHSLPRAEFELDYCGRTATLDRIRELTTAIAQRLGVDLVDLDRERAPSTNSKMMAA